MANRVIGNSRFIVWTAGWWESPPTPNRGAVVIGVHSSFTADKIGAFLKSKQMSFPVAVDAGNTAERYAIEACPTYYLLDKAGKIAWGRRAGSARKIHGLRHC